MRVYTHIVKQYQVNIQWPELCHNLGLWIRITPYGSQLNLDANQVTHGRLFNMSGLVLLHVNRDNKMPDKYGFATGMEWHNFGLMLKTVDS